MITNTTLLFLHPNSCGDTEVKDELTFDSFCNRKSTEGVAEGRRTAERHEARVPKGKTHPKIGDVGKLGLKRFYWMGISRTPPDSDVRVTGVPKIFQICVRTKNAIVEAV